MMYVICFYWQGDRWQQENYSAPEDHINTNKIHLDRIGHITNDLPAKYVNNLYHGVKKFADRPFQFICFTNENLKGLDSGIQIRPFKMVTITGVLPRLYMFSEEAGLFGHQVLCLDIDIVIVGALNDLMSYEGLFCARSKFKPGEQYKLDGDIMSFRAGEEAENLFWTPFINNIEEAEKFTNGRERYWIRHVADNFADRWDKYAPGRIVSYKIHIKKTKKIPKNVSVVSCHGVPRPHQIKDAWIKNYWR